MFMLPSIGRDAIGWLFLGLSSLLGKRMTQPLYTKTWTNDPNSKHLLNLEQIYNEYEIVETHEKQVQSGDSLTCLTLVRNHNTMSISSLMLQCL